MRVGAQTIHICIHVDRVCVSFTYDCNFSGDSAKLFGGLWIDHKLPIDALLYYE